MLASGRAGTDAHTTAVNQSPAPWRVPFTALYYIVRKIYHRMLVGRLGTAMRVKMANALGGRLDVK